MMSQPEIESTVQTDAVSTGLLELAAAALKQANCSSVPAQHSRAAPQAEPTEHVLDHCLPAIWKNPRPFLANGSELTSSEFAAAMQQQPPRPHLLPVRRKPRKPRTSASTNNSTAAAAPAAQCYSTAQPLQLVQQPHLQDGDCLQEAAYNDAADTVDMQMADAGAVFPDDDELYQPPGAAGAVKKQAGRGSRSRKGSSKAAGGSVAVARRSIKAASNSGDVSDATDSGLLYCAAGEDAAAAASKSKQDRLKEKNRLAQRRFRARQKTMLEQMQVRMDELAKQVEHSSKELAMLHKENLLLRNIVQEQQKALFSAVVQQQLLPDGAQEQQAHQETTADAAAAAAPAQQQQQLQLQRLQELYAAQIKLDEDQQAAAATAAVAAATAALHSAGEAMAAVTSGRQQ